MFVGATEKEGLEVGVRVGVYVYVHSSMCVCLSVCVHVIVWCTMCVCVRVCAQTAGAKDIEQIADAAPCNTSS